MTVVAAVVADAVEVLGVAWRCRRARASFRPTLARLAAVCVPLAATFAQLALALALGEGLQRARDRRHAIPVSCARALLQAPDQGIGRGLVAAARVGAHRPHHVHVLLLLEAGQCAGLACATRVLHLAPNPMELLGVGVELRAAHEDVEQVERHQLFEGARLHPIRRVETCRPDLLAQVLPGRQRIPQHQDVLAPVRVLVLARLGVAKLRRRALPLDVEAPPQLNAAFLARPRTSQQGVGQDVLDAFEEGVVDAREVHQPEVLRGRVEVGRQRFRGLLLAPDQQALHVRPVAAEVAECPIAPDQIALRLSDQIEPAVVAPSAVVHSELALGRAAVHRRAGLVRLRSARGPARRTARRSARRPARGT